MARITSMSLVLVLVGASTARAQTRPFIAITTASDVGERGNIPGGAVPSVGAMAGVRLTDAWSLEFEAERAFRHTTVGSGESVLISFPPSMNPTRAEIELYGIRVHDDRTQTAGVGWSALVGWRSRDPGRVNIGLLGGVSARAYTTTLVRRTTFVSPLIALPANYRLPDENSSRRMTGGGPTGGLIVYVRATRQLTIAPEFRMTMGLITDDRYATFRSGVRAIWAF